MKKLTRYQADTAADKINGYFLPRPGEATEMAFNRAKEETVNAYIEMAKMIDSLDYNSFLKRKLQHAIDLNDALFGL